MSDQFLEIGTTVAIQKVELDHLFAQLVKMGYQVIGPKAKDHTIIHAPLKTASELPLGYSSLQEPGKFQLTQGDHLNYFDVTNGPHSWKEYFFPSKSELMRFHKNNGKSWNVEEAVNETPHYAMVGVRPCDLAAIEIQDKVFMREAWCDPIYRARRENAFILAVNCMEPCGTCFCASMGTGPDARSGFDLCLTELENAFLIEIGSEAGRMAISGDEISWTPASAFLLTAAKKGLEAAREKMGRQLPNPQDLKAQLLGNLDHPEWTDVAKRCLSCASCTQVCPTCFCWDVQDITLLPGDVVVRERQWDSCFNPDYSYVAHGNTRPSTRSRYRQWLTHKFASWYEQFGTSGCTGCGRCITWCPAGIDHVDEIEKIREGALS
jgi:sulfhydrogenase subunit beta (sulfur reductase)